MAKTIPAILEAPALAGAFTKPNGYSNLPKVVMKVVSSNGTWWYPWLRYRVERNLALQVS
jgi:hypothetical protein